MKNPMQRPRTGFRQRRAITPGRVGALIAAALLWGSSVSSGAEGAAWTEHPADALHDSAVVSTDAGAVRGTLTPKNRLFQGIPYAAAPVGPLRWASPRPAQPWEGVRDARKPGNRCAQAQGLIDEASNTEDCLYLNVTTPRHGAARPLPVMVWIHGNGYISGAGSLYGAQQLASSGKVIVVSLNYRLGIFGFLAHPALDHGKARHLSGNFGLEDQQAALRWVQRNAAAFGGDPSNVTIFGESAGGTSVCSHMAAPSSAGLFHKAILQSAQCTGENWSPGPPTWFPRPRAEREQHGLDVAAKLGCPDTRTAAACLRAQPVQELAKWSDNGIGSGPTTGRGLLPRSPQRAFATGHFNRVPLIQGTTRDEHHLFTAAIEVATGEQTTEASYQAQIHTLFKPADASRILARYPSRHFHSPGEALSTVVTDWAWGCTVLARTAPCPHTFRYTPTNSPTSTLHGSRPCRGRTFPPARFMVVNCSTSSKTSSSQARRRATSAGCRLRWSVTGASSPTPGTRTEAANHAGSLFRPTSTSSHWRRTRSGQPIWRANTNVPSGHRSTTDHGPGGVCQLPKAS